MNKNKNWNRDKRGRSRGGFNRGGFGRGRGFGNRGNYSYHGGNYRSMHNQPGMPYMPIPRRELPTKRLSEEDIGVTEYMTDHEGFNAIIKARYSDFQVSEVNEKGEIAQLTDLEPPQPPEDDVIQEDEDLLLSKYNVELLPMETWDQINALAVPSEGNPDPVQIDVTGWSKEQRTKIHDAVKKAFGDCIVGSTVSVDDKKYVRFERYRKGVRIDKRIKWTWPGDYVYFIVHKVNCDTMEAANRIADRLKMNMKPGVLGYAGTKDRRAKTSQWFSVRRTDPRRLAAAAAGLRDVRLGNYGFGPVGLRLGMLRGNRFRIALRNVTAPDAQVERACSLLRERGFLNYYGLQRFGARRDVPTYRVGLLLLQTKFKEAIDTILEVSPGALQAALQAYKDEGPLAALHYLPRGSQHSPEARLIRSLAEAPKDLHNALNKIPRNTRLLYLHAYQSWVWNRCASERVRRLGLRAAPGDLVLLHANTDELVEQDSSSSSEAEAEAEEKPPERKAEARPKPVAVRALSAEDVAGGRYSVFDVVLPLPGHSVRYPPNMADYYESLLLEDGLTMTLEHKIRAYSMSGAYRALCTRAADVSWRLARYSAPDADLLPSDLDLLAGAPVTAVQDDGKYRALLLTMTLPASCYATMALRELLRVDTSCDHQAAQNDYHKRKRPSDDEDEGAKKSKDGEKLVEEKEEKADENKVEGEVNIESNGEENK